MSTFGFHGKLLNVDLTNRTAHIEEPGEVFWRLYGGGGLLAANLLLNRTPPGLDAFDPRNLLILSSSVVAGHPYAGLARFAAAGKSPLTGGIGETRCEGPFGVALKGSGVDAIVVTGASPSPVSLVIEDGAVTFADAGHLWGLETPQTVDGLEHDLGDGISTAVIGPAGENLVRFASIVADRDFQAARMGLGAVMGSKRLKAVVIRGDRHPPVADPGTCAALTRSYAARIPDNPLTAWQHDPPGFSAWIHTHGIESALCVRNYTESVFEAAEAYRPGHFMSRYVGVAECPGCPNDCIKVFAGGAEAEGRAAGIHQEITGALGSNLGLANLDDVLAANVLCARLGLDPTSLGFTLSMAMECREHGLLPQADAAWTPAFGDGAGVLSAIAAIAGREGFGDTLAEGARRAASAIGPAAMPYALHVKGLEMVPFEPRTQIGLALGYATAAIGPRYDICEHDWDYDVAVGWPHTLDGSRTLGIVERLPMADIGLEKVRNFKALQTVWSAADVLCMCQFAVAPTRLLSLHQMAEMLAAVTGWETSSHEIMRYGERRIHLMRVYNLREGFTAADDGLPDRFFDDPIRSGQWAGSAIDRDAFGAAIRAFYRMVGWDDAGRPHAETLADHHLGWTARYLP